MGQSPGRRNGCAPRSSRRIGLEQLRSRVRRGRVRRGPTIWRGDAQGRYEDAAPLYQRALAICEEVLGAKHPNVAVVLENYAALLQATGRSEEAQNLEARAQTIRASHI